MDTCPALFRPEFRRDDGRVGRFFQLELVNNSLGIGVVNEKMQKRGQTGRIVP
jgi:hypothetical protein